MSYSMSNHPEVEHIPSYWEDVWWDLEEDREFYCVVTGTPWQPTLPVERRRIERIYGRYVHKGCGGDWEYLSDKSTTTIQGNKIITVTECRCEDCNEHAIRCLRCGREICVV